MEKIAILVKFRKRGQITIPKSFRQILELHAGSILSLLLKGKEIIVRPWITTGHKETKQEKIDGAIRSFQQIQKKSGTWQGAKEIRKWRDASR